MKRLSYFIIICCFHTTLTSMYITKLFEKENVAQRIDDLHTQINDIKNKLDNAFAHNQPKILEQQLQQIPHINRLTSVFAYSYKQWYWRQFNAQMTVAVHFLHKDIRSSIQIMRKKQTGDLVGLQYSITLSLLSILDKLEKQKQMEFIAFKKDQKQLDIEDEIMSQKVKYFIQKQKLPLNEQAFSKQKSSSFSSLPNPFKKKEHDEKLPKIVEVIE